MPARQRFLSVAALAALALVGFPDWPRSVAADEKAPAQKSAAEKDPLAPSRLEFFEKRVRPLLVENCYNCHSANTNSRGGLRVDDRNGLIQGGGRGPAVVPGQPEKSLLIQAVRQTHAELKMPPMKRLTEAQIADLTQWIKDGAAWPQVRVPPSLGKPHPEYTKLRREHWAWQPLRAPKPPTVKDAAWSRDDIDRFILARLEAQNMQPVGEADALTLIRRVSFDLTGLPPTPEEMKECGMGPNAEFGMRNAEFEKGSQANSNSAFRIPNSAFERLVDRLLASPAFGERWGRHWLDVARYGESTGSARNLPYPHAWRYRDYVIDAFNADKPYDQFLREQIAGDLLPVGQTFLSAGDPQNPGRQESSPGAKGPPANNGRQENLPHELQRQRDEHLIATGFLALGVRDVNQRFKVRFVMDNIDEQIDTIGRAVLGLTISCARCHDHKFDPIPVTDYYALAGIFHSTDTCAGLRNKMGGGGLDYYDTAMLLPLGSREGMAGELAQKIEQAKTALAKARSEHLALENNLARNPPGPEREKKLAAARQKINAIQAELIALNDPAASGPVAFGVRDAKAVGDTEIRIRGEAEKLGPVVPRGFLSVFDVSGAPQINAKQSGRLELAQWLTSRNNPLTPRVIANRVWQHLFGRGLVSSVDNFGVTGDPPSHPELLDHLATRFIESGWSVKQLVRAIVLSRTYRLASSASPERLAANLKLDPANRLLWRHSPRRLDAEEIRDAMLAAAGKLDLNRPAGSPAKDFKVIELNNNGPQAKQLEAAAAASPHRSVYLPLVRGVTPRSLDVFDFAEQGMVTGHRDTTTVATQALYLLNDPFVRQQGQSLAQRLARRSDLGDADRIALVYGLTLGRPAAASEIERAKSYLAGYEIAVRGEGSIALKDSQAAAWASFCQAILASAEFRYLR